MDYDLKFAPVRKCENPHQREANCAQAHNAPFLVIGPQSPLSWRKAVAQIASYFKRELGFDFIPYNEREVDDFRTQIDRVLKRVGSLNGSVPSIVVLTKSICFGRLLGQWRGSCEWSMRARFIM